MSETPTSVLIESKYSFASTTPLGSVAHQAREVDFEIKYGSHCVTTDAEISDEDDDDNNIISRSDYWECTIIFSILGCCAAFFWEALLNCLPMICLQLYPESHNLSDRLTGVFNSAILIGAVILTVVSPLSKLIFNGGAVSLAVASVLVGMLCQWRSHSTSGAVMLGATCLLAGLGSGFTESATFAYATCLYRTHLSGCFSFGFGVSGIISFLSWLLWTRISFPEATVHDERSAVWAQQGLSAAIAVISILAFWRLTQLKSFTQWEAKSTPEKYGLHESLLQAIERTESGGMGLVKVIRATGTCQFHLGLVLCISYAIVPNLVPMTSLDTRHQRDMLVGVYQVWDFVGRYMANLSGFAPWIAIDQKRLVKYSYLRLFLLAIALFVMRYPSLPPMSDFPIQVIYLSICGLTNGWFLTLFMMYLTAPLSYDADRGQAVALSVMTQLGGCVFGLATVNVIKQIWN